MDQGIGSNKIGEQSTQGLLNCAVVHLQTIEDAGGEAFIVGGFVRDWFMKRDPKDLDIATNLKPQQVKDLFESKGYKVLPTGIDHGTVTLLDILKSGSGVGFEITTFRSEQNCDGRRADVQYVSTIEEDLARRDFTINAMALSKEMILIDPFNGKADIEAKVIRAVGDPKERFTEDYLRMMRAIRFACRLDFEIERETRNAIEELKHFILCLSKERIRDELNKMLESNGELAFKLLFISGILDLIIPEFYKMYGYQGGPHHYETVEMHTMYCLKKADELKVDRNLKVVTLLHDIAKPFVAQYTEDDLHRTSPSFKAHDLIGAKMAQDILQKYRYSGADIEDITCLIKYHLFYNNNITAKSIRKLAAKEGKDISFFRRLNILRKIDSCGNMKKHDCQEEIQAQYDYIESLLVQIENEKPIFTTKDLALKGKDIVELIGGPGLMVGSIQRELLDMVLNDPEKNNRESLSAIVKERWVAE